MLINLIFNRLKFNILIAIGVFAKQHIKYKKTYLFQIVCLSDIDNLHCLLQISINKIAFLKVS